MSEEDYIEQIRKLWDGSSPDFSAALRVARQGVAAHAKSVRLLCALGDLIQLADDATDPLEDALACYERAAAEDPTWSEAHESIGFYHDVHTQDFNAAEVAFRTALSLGSSEDAIVGLARVMAEKGYSRDEIYALLDSASDQASPQVCEMRSEIESGGWEPRLD
jgi:hypothetical protein